MYKLERKLMEKNLAKCVKIKIKWEKFLTQWSINPLQKSELKLGIRAQKGDGGSIIPYGLPTMIPLQLTQTELVALGNCAVVQV